MNYYPSKEEREWQGVCIVCGKMVRTIIIDRMTPRKRLESKAFLEYLGLDDDGDDEGPPKHDYREVTPCCKSEDFIPVSYAVRCSKCGEWADRRYCTRERGDAYTCPVCK